MGAIVRITPYQWNGDGAPPGEGDVLVTRAGSAYLIVAARQIARRPNRLALTCLKITLGNVPRKARVAELIWHPRRRS